MSVLIGTDVKLYDLTDHATILIHEWCTKNIGPENWDWCLIQRQVWFYKEEDAVAFKLKFSL